jgi:hypothetical protein
MEYPVRNMTDKVYFTAAFRLSSPHSTGSFSIYLDDKLIGQISVPNTGGWQNWETVLTNLRMEQGDHILRIAARTGGFNLNYFDLAIETEPGRAPYGGGKWQFPGDTVDAWKYDYVHFQEDGKYFSLDSGRTVGIYGCENSSGSNVRSYSDSADYRDAAQFNWNQSTGTMQVNGQWMEYTAELLNNLPYQLLIRVRNDVDANFLLTVSTSGGDSVFSRVVDLTDDLKINGSAQDHTAWKISDFELDLPMGGYVIKFDWFDQVGAPGIFGSFTFVESSLDLTPPRLMLVTTGIFSIGTFLEVSANEDATCYLVPSGTETNFDTITHHAAAVVEVSANVKAFISTAGLHSGDYLVYAIDQAGNISEPSDLIKLEQETAVDLNRQEAIETISISHDNLRRFISVISKNELSRLEIYDILGRKKADTDLSGLEASHDLSGLPAGIYLIQVEDLQGFRKTIRVFTD